MSLHYGFCLGDMTDSGQFSEIFHQVTGDGVTNQGGEMGLTVSGFAVSISTGFAFAGGRWLYNDAPFSLVVSPPSGNSDRFDAVAVKVDFEKRKGTLALVQDIDRNAAIEFPVIKNKKEYCVLLWMIRVRRGATSLTQENITDLRRFLPAMSEVSTGVLSAYEFVNVGFDIRVTQLIQKIQTTAEHATASVSALENSIREAGGTILGDLIVSAVLPAPQSEWLLCDGRSVPQEYPALSALLGGSLPNIVQPSSWLKTYIYAGAPVQKV